MLHKHQFERELCDIDHVCIKNVLPLNSPVAEIEVL